MRPNFAFDKRVAGRYNRQRAHPETVSTEIGQSIVSTVMAGMDQPAQPQILEVGFGTGRIGIPVAQAGGTVVGFDLSHEMLAALDLKSEVDNSQPFHLSQADMHAFPYKSGAFDAVLCVHVLHLAKDWRQVIREMKRSLKPNGRFIRGSDWLDPESVLARFRDELRNYVLSLMPNAMPPSALVSNSDMGTELGGEIREEVVASEWTVMVSPAERLQAIETKTDNESWFLPPPVHAQVLDHMKGWAAETWSDLDAPLPVTRRFNLTII